MEGSTTAVVIEPSAAPATTHPHDHESCEDPCVLAVHCTGPVVAAPLPGFHLCPARHGSVFPISTGGRGQQPADGQETHPLTGSYYKMGAGANGLNGQKLLTEAFVLPPGSIRCGHDHHRHPAIDHPATQHMNGAVPAASEHPQKLEIGTKNQFHIPSPAPDPKLQLSVNISSPTKKDHHITDMDTIIFESKAELGEKDDKLKVFAVEACRVQNQGNSTFAQATFNCVSLLYGLGILSSPYAVAKAGWTGAIISIIIASVYAYAAYLTMKCLQCYPQLSTYQDIAKLAVGRRTRVLITALFYIEITGTLLGYCISMGDNLAYVFPSSSFSLPGLSHRNFMIFVACLCILPTVWLRDLSALSFTSVWCIVSTIVLMIAVVLAATVNHVGFKFQRIPFLHIRGVPIAAGLYAFSFGGTAVFPSIYKSMKDPSKFEQVLLLSFIIGTASIAGLGVAGAAMFGENTASQITLSMPIRFITTKIVLWMTVLTPMFKFALLLSPITTALEIQLHRRWKASQAMLFGAGTLMRSTVLALIAIVAMVLPYFDYIVALIGSSMTICICMLFPCVFYLKLFRNTSSLRSLVLILFLMTIFVIIGAVGTFVSFKGLIDKRKSS